MPDDIVTRLRHIHMELTVDDYDDVITEAADEIVRLTARCESLERQLIDAEIRYATRLPL